MEKFVGVAASRPGCVGVLVVLDGEGDPVCELGPALLPRAACAKPSCVCLADPKYEAWLVASAETLDLEGLEYHLERDPEGLIREALPEKYIKPTFQPRLTAAMDIELAVSRSQSLTRLLGKFDELIGLLP